MTVLVGRCRIGKTSLLKKVIADEVALYLFVARKSEVLICSEFVEEIAYKMNVRIPGTVTQFKEI